MTLGRRLADTILITPQPAWPGLGVDTGCMRITIWVKPGSARPGAGGEHDGALVVRVSARAVDGKATEAALAAVAGSFGVRRSAVRLVSGASSRTKIVDIDAGDPRILAALLAAPGRLRPWQDAAAVRPSVMSDVITRSAATHPPQKRAFVWRCLRPCWVVRESHVTRPEATAGGGFPVYADGSTVEATGRHPPRDGRKGATCLCR